ncbi:VapC toxin family PIN domain ribonuclease [bacterium]|nr:VapC toxin family PIN domain ribonuclease [bacterium]
MEKYQRFGGVLATASVVWAELLTGCRGLPASAKRRNVEAFLAEVAASVPILPYDREAADWHAAERVRLARMGTPAPFADGQIAAIAKVDSAVRTPVLRGKAPPPVRG